MRCVLLVSALLLASPAAAEVTRVSITSKEVVAGGQAFGTTGVYEKLVGTIAFALDPRDPHNRAIVDLDLAPRGADGRVHFSSDLYVLRPVDAARGNGALLFEVSNRGGKGLLGRFNGAPRSADPSAPAEFGDGFLMREGYTLVWVGWEFDVAVGLRVDAPAAALPSRQPVAPISVRFIVDAKATETTLGRDAPLYPPANPAEPAATLTVRDRFWDRSTPVARERWRFVPGDGAPRLSLDGGFEPGRLYEVTYTAAGARVAGVGLAAIRDAASAFLYRSDLPVRGRLAYVVGFSQSGRFLRQFLYDGFNIDERDRRVFDVVWPHIAGAARGSFNERFAMPTSLSPYTGTRFPFADSGLLANYRPDQQPKIVQTNTSVEYWGLGRAAALTHTTPDGVADLVLPDNVRNYLLAGTQHGEAPMPPSKTNGQQMNNPTPQAHVMRALLRAIHRWASDGVPPPESRYPRLGGGTLTTAAGVRFPAIPGVRDPKSVAGPGQLTAAGSAPLPFLVPQVDADGNEIAGIRVPEQSVPLATTTGWNFRSEAIGNPGDIYSLLGSYLPFPVTKAERISRQDPRVSIEERYQGRDDYLKRVRSAALDLVRGRYLLQEDVEAVVERASAHWEYATKAK